MHLLTQLYRPALNNLLLPCLPKCVTEASYAWKLKKPIIPLRMEADFEPVDWLGIILGTKLYIDVFSDDEMTKNMEALIKAIGNRGRISCEELDGMHSVLFVLKTKQTNKKQKQKHDQK